MALDSDIQNPDAALWVQFEEATRHNTYKSEKEGRPIYEDCVNIRIAIPNNPHVVIVREADEADKARFPVQWSFFNNKRSGNAVNGTPVDELAFLSKAAKDNLKAAKFMTVEQIAAGSDQALQGMGMSAGMDGLALRERCIRYLEKATSDAQSTQLEAALKQRDTEIETLKGQMQQLIEMIQAKDKAAEPEVETEKRGPGRPRKEQSEAA